MNFPNKTSGKSYSKGISKKYLKGSLKGLFKGLLNKVLTNYIQLYLERQQNLPVNLRFLDFKLCTHFPFLIALYIHILNKQACKKPANNLI